MQRVRRKTAARALAIINNIPLDNSGSDELSDDSNIGDQEFPPEQQVDAESTQSSEMDQPLSSDEEDDAGDNDIIDQDVLARDQTKWTIIPYGAPTGRFNVQNIFTARQGTTAYCCGRLL
jgi:hypothetical protein